VTELPALRPLTELPAYASQTEPRFTTKRHNLTILFRKTIEKNNRQNVINHSIASMLLHYSEIFGPVHRAPDMAAILTLFSIG
jgi:hypothetical protein